MVFMPESTAITPGWPAANRRAHAAGLQSGWTARISCSASSGTLAKEPPLIGSITSTGLLCLRQTS